jgi:hypothetical protein
MDNTVNPQETAPLAQPEEPKEKQPEKKKGAEEFSVAWHLKVLAVIYVILGILYVILKFTLK